ncbi:TPA: hypothetical protein RFL89_000589 [Klebsiella aerogenes]|nr:hypothetical protein [Klebsiella aerogenes]
MSNIEKIKPEDKAGNDTVRTWQDDLANQPHLDSNSPIVNRALQMNSRGLNVDYLLNKKRQS